MSWHLEPRAAGSRMMRGLLRQEGARPCGRRHRHTRPDAQGRWRMGIDALYRKPNTSRRRPGHTVYPYLLRGLEEAGPTRCGQWTSVHSAWLQGVRVPSRSDGLVAARCWPGNIGHNRHRLLRGGARRIPGTPRRARRWRSTQIREASSQVTPSPVARKPMGSRSAWTGREAGRIMCSSNPVEERQVRGGVPESLRIGPGSQLDSGGTSLLQCRTAPFEPWGNDAGPVL